MHCTMCGAANADGAAFCTSCGAALAPPAAPGHPAAPTVAAPYAPSPYAAPAAPVQRPVGVLILAILDILGAVFGVLAGIVVALGFAAGGAALGTEAGFGPAFAAFGVAMGVFLVMMGVLSGFLAWGLLKGKAWARILHLVFAGFGLVSGVLGLLGAFATPDMLAFSLGVNGVGLAINGFLVWYFLQPGVKRWFEPRA